MVGIIVALSTELNKTFKTQIECNIHVSSNQKFYIYNQNNNVFVLVFSGVGKTNAALTTMNLIKTFNVKKIINIGSCGSANLNANIFDYIVANKFQYLDVDATAFNYKIGQLPKENEYFLSSSNLKNEIIEILNKNEINYKTGNIGTCDSFINKNNINDFYKIDFNQILCFDMESTAIAQVCNKNNVDFSSIKIVSDNINNNETNDKQFKNNLSLVSNKLTSLFFEIIKKIKN